MITGAVFVELSTAYDTVNHRILIQKILNTTRDSLQYRVIQNMLSSRRFDVELNNERSRWRNQKNGLPQGSVLSPVLLHIYKRPAYLPWNREQSQEKKQRLEGIGKHQLGTAKGDFTDDI